MSLAAANYHLPNAATFLYPKVIFAKAIVARSCEAISPQAGTAMHEITKGIFGASEIEFPYVPRNPMFQANCGTSIDGCVVNNAETDFTQLNVVKKRVSLCHTIRDTLKVDAVDWDRMENQGQSFFNMLTQNHLNRYMTDVPDIANLGALIGQAAAYNRGKLAGRKSRKIDLGDTAAPVVAGYAGDGAVRRTVARLSAVLAENNIRCSKIDPVSILVSNSLYSYLIEDYTSLKQGACCVTDAETGGVKDSYGHRIIPTNNMPCVLDVNGEPLEYMIAVSKKDWAVPFKVHYDNEWIKQPHMRVLPVAFSWGSYVFDPESTAHAVMRVTPV